MGSRNFPDWLLAFCEYAGYGEAPRRMNFWAGVSAIAGALRRRVWIDQFYFRWIPNFYIVFVAPPGVVSKSTTADKAMDLLKEVPGIHFGPDIVTWQALVTSFGEASEMYLYDGMYHAESAVTCAASELGNLLNPRDRDLVDLLVTLWDNRKSLDKATKHFGSDHIAGPSANIIGCTTPSWLQENVPSSVVEGGLTSRVVFVFADRKERLVAYPGKTVPKGMENVRKALIEDLTAITKLCGEYKLTGAAEAYGEAWYKSVWEGYKADEEIFGNYIARKQTHLHKLAMVLAAAQRDELVIEVEDLQIANQMLHDTEVDMPRVFSRMGKSQDAVMAEKLIQFVKKNKSVTYEQAYRFLHAHFPSAHDSEEVIAGCVRSGYMDAKQVAGDAGMLLVARMGQITGG